MTRIILSPEKVCDRLDNPRVEHNVQRLAPHVDPVVGRRGKGSRFVEEVEERLLGGLVGGGGGPNQARGQVVGQRLGKVGKPSKYG